MSNVAYLLLGVLVLILIAGAYMFTMNDAVVVDTATTTPTPQATTTAPTTTPQITLPVQVIPVTHATAILEWGTTTIYTDPTIATATAFRGRVPEIILVTDIHGDHLSTSTLSTLVGSSSLIVPQAVKDLLPKALADRAQVLLNGESITVQGFKITAIPMYNLPESADARHTKGRGNGYVIERDGYRVYVAGDTAGTPEMHALTDIDMAFVPMNLPFTMGVEEAAEAVIAFAPKRVYPYHYRGQDGLSDIQKFKTLVDAANIDTEVILLNWYPAQP